MIERENKKNRKKPSCNVRSTRPSGVILRGALGEHTQAIAQAVKIGSHAAEIADSRKNIVTSRSDLTDSRSNKDKGAGNAQGDTRREIKQETADHRSRMEDPGIRRDIEKIGVERKSENTSEPQKPMCNSKQKMQETAQKDTVRRTKQGDVNMKEWP
jgi:hypothetical protein